MNTIVNPVFLPAGLSWIQKVLVDANVIKHFPKEGTVLEVYFVSTNMSVKGVLSAVIACTAAAAS